MWSLLSLTWNSQGRRSLSAISLVVALHSTSVRSVLGFSAPSTQSDTHLKLTLDHLVYVVPDLEEGIDEIERLLGVRPAIGGKHSTLGTHNALLALGNGRYLELFAPDPQSDFLKPLIGVDGGRQPRLATFCCDAGHLDLEKFIQDLQEVVPEEYQELLPTKVDSGSRRNQDDNKLISWRLGIDKHTVPWDQLPMDGLIPFFIDWDVSCRDIRPAMTAPSGCTLTKLKATTPDPKRFCSVIASIGYGLDDILLVEETAGPTRLTATIQTPSGGLVEIS